MKVIGVIPARWASTRFQGKVLADLHGQPMVQHVWERVKGCGLLSEVLIACDHEAVFKAAEGFQANVIMTSPDHPTGTDRIAEIVKDRDADIIVNIQADEPLVRTEIIDALIRTMMDDLTSPMGTVIKRIEQEEEILNPNVVKVVVDRQQYALYFSRSPIPLNRDNKPFSDIAYYKHLGMYAYRKDFLMIYHDLPASTLESLEKLEQLRVLEAGYKIKTVKTEYEFMGVDTPEDLERVSEILRKKSLPK